MYKKITEMLSEKIKEGYQNLPIRSDIISKPPRFKRKTKENCNQNPTTEIKHD